MTEVDATRPVPHGTISGYVRHRCRCAECGQVKSDTDRQYRQANAERIAEAKAASYQAQRSVILLKAAERRASRTESELIAAAEYQRQWRVKNAQRIAERKKARAAESREVRQRYVEVNREVIRAREIAYREANPEKRRTWEAVRRARLQRADVRIVTERQWHRVLLAYNNRCAYCGCVGTMTQDHVIPLVRGGRHSIGNLVPACGPCNSSKNSRLIVEWRAAKRQAA